MLVHGSCLHKRPLIPPEPKPSRNFQASVLWLCRRRGTGHVGSTKQHVRARTRKRRTPQRWNGWMGGWWEVWSSFFFGSRDLVGLDPTFWTRASSSWPPFGESILVTLKKLEDVLVFFSLLNWWSVNFDFGKAMIGFFLENPSKRFGENVLGTNQVVSWIWIFWCNHKASIEFHPTMPASIGARFFVRTREWRKLQCGLTSKPIFLGT